MARAMSPKIALDGIGSITAGKGNLESDESTPREEHHTSAEGGHALGFAVTDGFDNEKKAGKPKLTCQTASGETLEADGGVRVGKRTMGVDVGTARGA